MIEIEASCGNVSEDLQVNEAAAMQVKAGLASKIADIIRHRRLKQQQAAEILGIPQPKLFHQASSILDVYALLVDAINDQAGAFYLHHGFLPLPSLPASLVLPLNAILHLMEQRQAAFSCPPLL
ncbi:MAG: XRE family transcriptional regulator [Candidatus Competibacter sp.]|nr:XRE family transcriptional regulator [Candidatus Competibacter sp.]